MEIPEWVIWPFLILVVALGIIGGIYSLTWAGTLPYAGQKYDVTVIVQAVEKSSRYGEHTNLWVQVYGEQDITYKLIGYHDFKIGKTYHLVFVDEPYQVNFIVWWFEVRGRVQLIEEV